jgi:hypothetical protein
VSVSHKTQCKCLFLLVSDQSNVSLQIPSFGSTSKFVSASFLPRAISVSLTISYLSLDPPDR